MNDIRVSKHISMQYPKANEINIENYENLKRRGGGWKYCIGIGIPELYFRFWLEPHFARFLQ